MRRDVTYLLFGLLVLGAYAYVGREAIVFSSASREPTPPAARPAGAGPRAHPTFWSTGYLGGK